MIDAIRKLMAPLHRAILMTVGAGEITLVKEGDGLQKVQISLLKDEVLDDVVRFQAYGLTARPFAGAKALFLAVGGRRSAGVVAAVDDPRYRPTDLEEGEVALYDDQGQQVNLKRDGVLIRSPNGEVTIDAANGPVTINVINARATVNAQSVVINSDSIDLGGEGGMGLARIGDAVTDGVITGGSDRVRST